MNTTHRRPKGRGQEPLTYCNPQSCPVQPASQMSILKVTIALLQDALATLGSVEEGAVGVSLPRVLLLHPKGGQVDSDSFR